MGRNGNVLSRLDNAGLLQMKEVLRQAHLPAKDLHDNVLAFRLDDAAGALGWAALERFGDQALLRSVVIVAERREQGSGSDLVRQMIAVAGEIGVQRLWLLTETAAAFFERLGFQTVGRATAPEAIQRTSEFRECCPASATCMTLVLRGL